ncbi:hypothetical protein V490_09345 [Pseudogymnoascus sp. VKM F-3557]|nr:hypothetical protein V490_09345 [Pseudogymnoascus sp. VKM F-3557]
MAFVLPKQEDESGTYMELESISWLIKNRLRPELHEGETKRIWITILSWFFSAAAGYATGPEMTMDGQRRADVVATHIFKTTRMNEINFLVVECKAQKYITTPTAWGKAFGELKGYLAYIYHNKYKKRSGKRLFGAIAIGRTVKFYEWVGGKDSPLKVIAGEDQPLYINRQCRTVTDWLTYIRENHV